MGDSGYDLELRISLTQCTRKVYTHFTCGIVTAPVFIFWQQYRSGNHILLFWVQEIVFCTTSCINLLTPNDNYSGRTAPLTSKCCILYIYSTNIGTEYFKHGIYSPFFPLQNAVCFINLIYLVPVLFTFYIQGVLKLKK